MNKDALAYANVHSLSIEATCQALQWAPAVSVSSEVPHSKLYIPQSEARHLNSSASSGKHYSKWRYGRHTPKLARRI
jgi:hypothetical protein